MLQLGFMQVGIMKAPLPENETARLEALRKCNLSDLQRTAVERKQAPKGRSRFFTKIAAGFGLASVLLAGVGLVSYRNLTSLIQTTSWQRQHYKLIHELEDIRFQLQKAAIAKHRYITTPEARYLKTYDDAVKAIEREITQVQQAIANKPDQQRRLAALETLVTRK